MSAKLERLRERLRSFDEMVVAFSGGADSAFLAWVATDTLGADRVLTVTAVSPSLAGFELDDCRELVDEWDLRWKLVETEEMANAAYQRNDANRCFHCKDALMDALAPLCTSGVVVALGVNVDDLGDHRPGQRAADLRGAVFPLVDAGFTKAEVRSASAALGLRTWDKPAAACLASRVPYGTPVTVGVLASVERAERSLRRLGFLDLRVRHYRDLARIEVPVARLGDVVEHREPIVAAVHEAGYRYVTLDLEGLRSGNLNDGLRLGGGPRNQTEGPTRR